MTFLNAARVLLCVVAVTVLSGHVAPSVDDNNRYLKVTPLHDGVRLAYTVFFGEIPGASERRSIDENRDGRIDDAEAQRFADKLAAQVAEAIDIDVDGSPHRIRWDLVAAGMGSDAVAAGSFSIDLVAFACGKPGASHKVLVRDQFRIPRPGETEVKVEDSPGVTIHSTRIGGATWEDNDYKLIGPSGALETDGLELQFTAGDGSLVAADAVCRAASPGRALPTGAIVGAAAVISLVLAGAVALVVRFRRRRGRIANLR